MSAVLSIVPGMRRMTLLSMSIAWLLVGTVRIQVYAELDPMSATEVSGLKSALHQLGKLKNFSYGIIQADTSVCILER